MITIKKNNPIIPTTEIYPYYLENSWEQRIDCSENELKELYENLKGIFYDREENVVKPSMEEAPNNL